MFHHQKIKVMFCIFTTVLFAILFTSLAQPSGFRGHSTLADDKVVALDDVTVSATIGTVTKMIIYGYAPVASQVILTGDGISEVRNADANGYFSFDNIGTTGSSSTYPELCLVAHIDALSTQPTCLPSLPGGNVVYEIGPVILSPIISIEQNTFLLGTQVALNGVTTPNSEVKIYLAGNKRNLALVRRALAYQIPEYKVTSNALGKFQFNLPSNYVAKWRVYAATTYMDSNSPISNTLNFTVETNIKYYLRKITETVTKITNIITTVITTKTNEEVKPNNSTSLYNISTNEVDTYRSRMPYFVMIIEGLILVLLATIILNKRRKNKAKPSPQLKVTVTS